MRVLTVRIDDDTLRKLEHLVKKTGKNKTVLVRQAIQSLWVNEEKTTQEIELLSKQNEQLQMAMSATKALLQEKERIIKLQENLIKELQERKQEKKSFWSRIFGK